MNICPNCKKEFKDGINICPYCNNNLSETSAECNSEEKTIINETEKINEQPTETNNQQFNNNNVFNYNSSNSVYYDPINQNTNTYDNTISNKKGKKKKAIILVAIIAIIIFALITISKLIPLSHYNSAKSNLENGNYDDAISAFTDLGDYKDSKTLLLEAYYQAGMQAVNDSDFKLAKEYFAKCDGYSNSDTALAMINLYNAYALCSSSRTSLSSDCQSITVDSENKNDTESLSDIITIISALNLPDSLRNEMAHTTALMGVQEETFSHYTVRWTYHPDNGLDVIFKLN